MAYQYDEMGNVIGEYESEEERRRREAANQPVKQTITYNPDGSQEMTIKGTPEALSPINPNTPTLSQPNQPMPMAQPKPQVQVQPTQQDRESQRRAILQAEQAKIQQQLQTTQDPAMIDRLRRDQQALQNEMMRGQGQRVPSVAQSMGKVVNNLIPSAQAGTVPPQPQQPKPVAPSPMMAQPQMAPQPQPQPQMAPTNYSLSTGMGQQGLRAPGMQPTLAPDSSFFIKQYVDMQDDPRKLIQYGFTETIPEPLRDRAKSRAAELIQQQQGQQEAQQRLATMNESELAKAMREKTTGGSYIKAIMFGLLGMENSALAESAKLGIGKETMTTVNGQPAIVKMAVNGTPISGYNAQTGKKLSAQELVTAAQSATLMKGANIGGQVYRDPVTNETLTKVDTQQGPIYFNKAQQRVVPKGEPVPLTAGSDISTQLQLSQMKRQQQFVSQTASARLKAFEDTNAERALAGYPLLSLQDMGLTATGELAGAAQPTAQAAAAQPSAGAPTAGAPAAQPAAQVPTGAALKSAREAQQTIVTDAAKQVAASADTQNMLGSIDKITNLLDSDKHNVGSVLSGFAGRGPVAQAIGGQFETEDAKNTKTILDTVNKLAADGLKALGTNPSTVDLEFWTKYKPDGGSN